MIRSILVVLIITALAFGGFARGTGDFPVNPRDAASSGTPGIPMPGKGGDVLFVMAAMSFLNGNAWGAQYWNPDLQEYPSTWAYDTVNPSTGIPTGTPYHWNGGMGTALDNLGYTWEWYPTYDGEDPSLQTIPPSSTMLADYNLVIYWVGDYWNPTLGPALSNNTMSELEAYMTAGGALILIGQDLQWSGVPAAWLDTWFSTGTIAEDVLSAVPTVPASGITGTFAEGWSGTADRTNFYTEDTGNFFPDDMGANGFIGDGTWEFGCVDNTNFRIYSTMQFGTCASSEVEALMGYIMTWLESSLQQSTWGDIKSNF